MPVVVTEEGAVDLGKFCAASVDRIGPFDITKDGIAWTGISSVTFTFEAPDRETQFTRAGTLLTVGGADWYYDTLVTDIAAEEASLGNWTVGVKVVAGAVVKYYPHEIYFEVNQLP